MLPGHQGVPDWPLGVIDHQDLVTQSLKQPHIERGHAGQLASKQTILEAGGDQRELPASVRKRLDRRLGAVTVTKLLDGQRAAVSVKDSLGLGHKAEHGVDLEVAEAGRGEQGGEGLED